MRYLFLLFTLLFVTQAGILKSTIVKLDEDKTFAAIKINKIDVGMSGFVVHHIADDHSVILKNAVVTEFDENSSMATLELSDFDALRNNSLPSGKWEVSEGDEAIFAFGYDRALLIAPNEEIYHRISKGVRVQWVHPDLFAIVLSYRGHPTPLKEDFDAFNVAASVGLVFIYLDQKVYMLDCKSFKILSITDAPFEQKNVQLPFYSRVEEIDANWFGEGSDELESYNYYYSLLHKYNKDNSQLNHIIEQKHIDIED